MSLLSEMVARRKPHLGAVLAAAGLIVASSPAFAQDQRVVFEHTEVGAASDPTGLFSDEEVAEGGSASMPSVWYSTFPVDGGEVTISVLSNAWCGMSDCPFRYRIKSADGNLALRGYEPPNYGSICQSFLDGGSDAITYDPMALTIDACGSSLDLKMAR